MFSGFSDFLNETLTENVKGILKPANWLVSAIFIILNLIFILPVLLDENILSPTNVFILNPSLQLTVAVVLILLLAYLLSSMKQSIFSLIAGNFSTDSPFLERIKQEKENFAKDITRLRGELVAGDLIEGLNKPIGAVPPSTSGQNPPTDEYMKPIAVSAAMRKVAQAIENDWGINVEYLFHYIEGTIGNEMEWKRVNDEQEGVDFFVSLTFILTLFAIEQILVQLFWKQGLSVVWGWLFLGLAYITYKLAENKASTWGAAVERAVTIHHETLRQEFGLRPFKDSEDEKEAWRAVSQWRKSGYIPDAILPSQVTASAVPENVKVTIQSGTSDIEMPEWEDKEINGTMRCKQRVYQHIDYVMLVSNTKTEGDGSETKDIYVLISDPKVPVIHDAPSATVLINHPVPSTDITSPTQKQADSSVKSGSKPGIPAWFTEITKKMNILADIVPTNLPVSTSPHLTEERDNNLYSCKVIPASPADAPLAAKVIPARPTYQHHPLQLLWYIAKLESNKSIALEYQLPSRIVRAVINKLELDIEVDYSPLVVDETTREMLYKITIKNKDENKNRGRRAVNDVKIDLFDNRRPFPPFPWKSPNADLSRSGTSSSKESIKVDLQQDCYSVKVLTIAWDEQVVLEYRVSRYRKEANHGLTR